MAAQNDPQALAAASIVRWLRRQLRQPTPEREHLEAAVHNEDVAEVRRLLGRVPFTDGQRRYLEDLLERWERALSNEGAARRDQPDA